MAVCVSHHGSCLLIMPRHIGDRAWKSYLHVLGEA
ncbi:hypothetical protein NMG60_11035628 [Bertholletia excelsa]